MGRGELLVRGAKDVWPVNLAGVLGRVITLSILVRVDRSPVPAVGDDFGPGHVSGCCCSWALSRLVLNLLWYNAMRWTTATNAAVLFRIDLVFVVLIGTGMGLERIHAPQVLLLCVMLLGLAVFTEVHHFDLGGHLVGDLMVIGAACGYAINAFIIRRILVSMDEMAVSFYNLAFSGIGFAGMAWVSGEFTALPRRRSRPHRHWWWIIALGVATAVSLPLYYAALGRMREDHPGRHRNRTKMYLRPAGDAEPAGCPVRGHQPTCRQVTAPCRASSLVDEHYGNDGLQAVPRPASDAPGPQMTSTRSSSPTGDRWHARPRRSWRRRPARMSTAKNRADSRSPTSSSSTTASPHGRIFQAGTQRRSVPQFQTAVQVAHTGQLGTAHASCERYTPSLDNYMAPGRADAAGPDVVRLEPLAWPGAVAADNGDLRGRPVARLPRLRLRRPTVGLGRSYARPLPVGQRDRSHPAHRVRALRHADHLP